jgi:hypothetical protein
MHSRIRIGDGTPICRVFFAVALTVAVALAVALAIVGASVSQH